MSSSDDDTFPSSASDEVRYWLSQIAKAERDMDKYHRRCDRIRKRYLFEGTKSRSARQYQMLWANQEILRPAVYAKCPAPAVQTRFRDGDAVVRITSELLERAMDVQIDLGDFNSSFEIVRNHYLLYARGAARLLYDADFDLDEVDDGVSDTEVKGEDEYGEETRPDEEYEPVEVDEDYELQDGEKEAPPEVLKEEHIKLVTIHRRDLIHPKSRTWEDLPWLCFRAFMSRAKLRKRFPDCADAMVLDAKPGDYQEDKEDTQSNESMEATATVYEIWDKEKRKVIWIAKAYPDVLESGEPYLGKLTGFYPMPKPAYGTLDDESLVPVPDFVFYQDQANEINDLTARIASLSDSLKLVGFYPAGPEGEGAPEVEKAVKPGFENKMIAVKSWAAFAKGMGSGKDGAPIVWLPVEMVATIIEKCVALRKQLIDDVYQLTGISDIMRGDTEAEETAAAQAKKSNWGAVRLKTKQNELARFAKDVMRLMAEIMAQRFQVETLLECANLKLPTDAAQEQANQQFQEQQAIAARQAALQQAQHAQLQPPGGQQSPGQPVAPMGAHPVGLNNPQAPNGPAPAMAGAPSVKPGGPIQGPGGPGPAPAPGAEASSVTGSAPPQAPPPPQQPPDLGPTVEDVKKMLQERILTRYVVDIETDSTILLDQEAEQTKRTEFITETGRFLGSVMPLAESQPVLLPFLSQLFLFGVRAFPVARELQDAAEKLVEKMEEQSGQPAKPNPQQAKAEAEIQSAKIGQQTEIIRAQAEQMTAKLKLQQAQADHQHNMAGLQMDMQAKQMDHQLKQKSLQAEIQTMQQKFAAQQALEGQKMQHQKELADIAHSHALIEGQTKHDQAINMGQMTHANGMAALQAQQTANKAKPGLIVP